MPAGSNVKATRHPGVGRARRYWSRRESCGLPPDGTQMTVCLADPSTTPYPDSHDAHQCQGPPER
eukprot:scaffold14075_cov58-Phaeocystis_antarctica.AAC.1